MSQTIDVSLFYTAFVCYAVSMLIYFLTFWKRTGTIIIIGRIVLLSGFLFQVAGLILRTINASFRRSRSG